MEHRVSVEEALDYDRFAAWLQGYQGMVIGIPGHPMACPLAIYLRETVSSTRLVKVGRASVALWEGGRRTVAPLPLWAIRFVQDVVRCGTAVTAEEAANILLPRDLLAVEEARVRQPQARGALGRAAGLVSRFWAPAVGPAPVSP